MDGIYSLKIREFQCSNPPVNALTLHQPSFYYYLYRGRHHPRSFRRRRESGCLRTSAELEDHLFLIVYLFFYYFLIFRHFYVAHFSFSFFPQFFLSLSVLNKLELAPSCRVVYCLIPPRSLLWHLKRGRRYCVLEIAFFNFRTANDYKNQGNIQTGRSELAEASHWVDRTLRSPLWKRPNGREAAAPSCPWHWPRLWWSADLFC